MAIGLMNGENWLLVTDEPVEFDKWLVGVPRLQETYWSCKRNLGNLNLKLMKKISKDVNV